MILEVKDLCKTYDDGKISTNILRNVTFSLDEGEFVSIEKHTAVNHAGSVVTKEPIDLGEQGYISFTDDTSPDFKGEIMSLYEFWEYDPEQSQTEDLEMEMK